MITTKLISKVFVTGGSYYDPGRDEDVYEGVDVLVKEDELDTFLEVIGELCQGFLSPNTTTDGWKTINLNEEDKGEAFDEVETFFIEVEGTRRSGHGRLKHDDGAVTVVRRWLTHSAKVLCGMTPRTAKAVEELCKELFNRVVVRVATDADLDLE